MNILDKEHFETECAVFTLRKILFFQDAQKLGIEEHMLLNTLCRHKRLCPDDAKALLYAKAGQYVTKKDANADDLIQYVLSD